MKGFIPKFYRDGQPDAYKYLPADANSYTIGKPLCVSGGRLTAAYGTDKVQYISMYEGDITEETVIPVIAVDQATEYEVVLENAVAGLVPGMKCKLDELGTGLSVLDDGEEANVIVLTCTGESIGDTAVVQFI